MCEPLNVMLQQGVRGSATYGRIATGRSRTGRLRPIRQARLGRRQGGIGVGDAGGGSTGWNVGGGSPSRDVSCGVHRGIAHAHGLTIVQATLTDLASRPVLTTIRLPIPSPNVTANSRRNQLQSNQLTPIHTREKTNCPIKQNPKSQENYRARLTIADDIPTVSHVGRNRGDRPNATATPARNLRNVCATSCLSCQLQGSPKGSQGVDCNSPSCQTIDCRNAN